MTDLHAKTLTELAAGLDNGEFSSVELTQALLDRIAAHDESLNALVSRRLLPPPALTRLEPLARVAY